MATSQSPTPRLEMAVDPLDVEQRVAIWNPTESDAEWMEATFETARSRSKSHRRDLIDQDVPRDAGERRHCAVCDEPAFGMTCADCLREAHEEPRAPGGRDA